MIHDFQNECVPWPCRFSCSHRWFSLFRVLLLWLIAEKCPVANRSAATMIYPSELFISMLASPLWDLVWLLTAIYFLSILVNHSVCPFLSNNVNIYVLNNIRNMSSCLLIMPILYSEHFFFCTFNLSSPLCDPTVHQYKHEDTYNDCYALFFYEICTAWLIRPK